MTKQSQPSLLLRGGVADVAIWEVWGYLPHHTDCFASRLRRMVWQ